MSGRLRILFVVVIGLVGVLVARIELRRPQPVHEGKMVSQWIDELKIGVGVFERSNSITVYLSFLTDEELAALKLGNPKVICIGRNSVLDAGDQILHHADYLATEPANVAIRMIGADALPCLVAKLATKDSRLSKHYRELWPKLPSALQRIVHKPISPVRQRANAAYGLGLLGPAAKPVLPVLFKALNDGNELVRSVAAEAIRKIEPAVAPKRPEGLFAEAPRVTP
ncbi:MAG: HEAT repeat domain-containing protein [Verrucomicrobia bacterium]|nr:HEAT repeat domain-containing protein [Verrucomicrobiota bacterium]